jgi:hypothetical protein
MCGNNCSQNCESKQIDSTDVFYKIKCEVTPSILQAISITNGMSLQAIIEILGLHIINEVQIANPVVVGQPNIETYQQVIDYLLGLNTARVAQITQLQSQINTINTTILALNNRLVSVEKPGVVDSAGAGFTIYSDLKTVLQKLTDAL